LIRSQLHYLLREPKAPSGFRTGVSLHGHTLHSRESTSFVVRLTRKSKLFSWFIHGQLRKYAQKHGNYEFLDLEIQTKRMWWTSPLSAAEAFQVEKKQVNEKLGLEAIVSLSDHDNIDGPRQLQMIADNAEAPVSVEWTAPYRNTYFHIGVHNLNPQTAVETMLRMERFTAQPSGNELRELLAEFHAEPGMLVVLNHPFWDQPWLGQEAHEQVLRSFLRENGEFIHALEINGLRSWVENRKVVRLAKETGFPLISGGDRHGREPNATLNLTNAATFAEFADEIRGGAPSHVLMMPQFHDPLVLRMLQTMGDVLRDYPEHAAGQVRWSDRVFRKCTEGHIKSFSQFFVGREPFLMRQMILWVEFMTSPRLRPAWQRIAIPAEAAL
jgi:hypothetical protein